jgi:GT2 family glycosyltransferase
MLKKPEILISILTYNSTYFIEDCLLSIKNQTSQNFKCFVFDNNSTDNIKEVVSKYKFVEFIQVGKNDGYTGGHNFAFNYFKQNYPKNSFMLVLNPDTKLDKNYVIEALNFISLEPNFVLANPLIKEGNVFSSTNNFFSLSFTPLSHVVKGVSKKIEKTRFVQGCCMLINLKRIDTKTLFKNYFMYFEDTQLSLFQAIKNDMNFVIHATYVEHINKDSFLPWKVFYCEKKQV